MSNYPTHDHLSPIQVFPPEIILAIVCSAVLDIPASRAEHYVPDPWSPSQVCRSWRQLSRTTAVLWSVVNVGYKSYHHINTPITPNLFRLQEQLSLSSNAPLDVHILFDRFLPLSDEENIMYRKRKLVLLNAHRSRWKRASISITADLWKEIGYSEASSSNWPLLTSLNLVLRWTGDDLNEVLGPRGLSVEEAPNLVQAHLVVYDDDWSFRYFELPWRQLKDVVIKGVKVSAVTRIIQNLHVVERLVLDGSSYEQEHDDDLENQATLSVTLPWLKKLDISYFVPSEEFAHLIGALTLPNLEELHVSLPHWDTSSIQPIADLIRRSQCPLATFNFRGALIHSTKPDIRALFPLLTSLQELSLEDKSSYTPARPVYGILRFLTDNTLVPNLRKLSLHSVQIDVESFSGFLTARSHFGMLKNLSLLSCFPISRCDDEAQVKVIIGNFRSKNSISIEIQ